MGALRNSISARAEIRQTLDQAGIIYQNLLTDNVIAVAKTVVTADNGLPDFFDVQPAIAIDNATTGLLSQVSTVFGEASQQVRQVMMSGLIGGRDPNAVLSEMNKRLEVMETYTKTITTTALHSAARAATVEIADDSDLDFLYVYSGPDDRVTRPFCRFYGFPNGQGSRVAYTRDALRALSRDPNQVGQPGGESGDVAAFGGGYNCRHNWNAFPVFVAERDGYEIRTEDDVMVIIAGGGSRKFGIGA
jgi:hypothetical protein